MAATEEVAQQSFLSKAFQAVPSLASLMPVVAAAFQGKEGFRSLAAGMTGAELTGAQREANQWNLEMDNTKYQRSTEDMQLAGLNPALVYGGGNLVSTQATGSQQGSAGAGSAFLNALLSAAQVQSQVDLNKAQARNLEANTKKQETETEWIPREQQAIINKMAAETGKINTEQMYQQLMIDAGIPAKTAQEIMSRIGVNSSVVDKNVAEKELAQANKAVQEFDLQFKKDTRDLQIALLQSKNEQQAAAAAADYAKAAIDQFRRWYMGEYAMDVPSGAWASLFGMTANAIKSTLGSLVPDIGKAIGEAFKEAFKRDKKGKEPESQPEQNGGE